MLLCLLGQRWIALLLYIYIYIYIYIEREREREREQMTTKPGGKEDCTPPRSYHRRLTPLSQFRKLCNGP